MPSTAEKRADFQRLHESGCFVLPNPWDVGSARYLQHLGFAAVATTSAGFAWSQGRSDNSVSLDMALHHCTAVATALDIPLNADFEGGFASQPEEVAENVALCCATGVAGLSIEDSTGGATEPLYPMDLAVERVRAARQAINRAGPGVVFTARCEGLLVGVTDLDAVIRRLRAYAEAGADCLYAPGLRTREQIAAVVRAVSPKPVNVLVGWPSDLTVEAIAALGARRISVGGALARSAWGGFIRAAKEIAASGTFGAFADAAPGVDLNGLFRPGLSS